MIINHQLKLCFFAIPRTASTAISTLLIEKYNSTFIPKRHSSFNEFKKTADKKELSYFKFASIRNPLDSVVSAYFKKKTDHNGRFSRGHFKDGRPINKSLMEEYHFITSTNASFQSYFLKFHTKKFHRPRLEHTIKNMDALVRFEYLNEDFKKIMDRLNLPFHPIPVVNPTMDRNRDFLSLYTPDIQTQAVKVFSPIMKNWGYSFPEEWSIKRPWYRF